MTIKEYRRRIAFVNEGLARQAEIMAIAMASDGLTMVRNRSRKQGIWANSEPGNFVSYSDKAMLTFKFRDQSLNSRGVDYVKKHRVGTWADFKKAQGLPAENVTVDYSGRFWTSLGVINQTRVEDGFFVQIGSTDPKVQTYIGDLFERYGNFIVPSREEQRLLLVSATNQFTQFLLSNL